MKNAKEHSKELKELCTMIKNLANKGDFDACIDPIFNAMKLYPDSPEPHNLLGIILEKTGNHTVAMKHFRMAWKLDPTYLPTNHNLITYGTFLSTGTCAYDESDVPIESNCNFEITYDEYGLGHVHTKNKIKHEKHGIVRIVRR